VSPSGKLVLRVRPLFAVGRQQDEKARQHAGPFCVHGYPNPLRESACLKLLEVAFLMADVVLDEKAEGDRCILANSAHDSKAVFGNPIDSGHQDLVLRLPPAQQRFPRLVAVSVRGYPRILGISGTGIQAIDCGADEAVAVVGR